MAVNETLISHIIATRLRATAAKADLGASATELGIDLQRTYRLIPFMIAEESSEAAIDWALERMLNDADTDFLDGTGGA